MPIQNNIQIPIAEVKQPAVVPMVQVPAVHTEHLIKVEANTEGANHATDANGAPKKRWNRQPINKKIKRIRRNRRLRKMLIPKNALMSLNELMGSTLSDFNFTPEERGFVTHFYVNNIQYEGRGTSKTAAKNNASEKALRDIIIQKMVQAPKAVPKVNLTGTTDGECKWIKYHHHLFSNFHVSQSDDPFNEDVEMQEGDGDDDETTEVPMMHLASFALHKLFSEWQAEGFEIPDFKNLPPPAAGTAAQADEKMAQQPLAAPRAEVPEKAEAMHPTTLLCMVRTFIHR